MLRLDTGKVIGIVNSKIKPGRQDIDEMLEKIEETASDPWQSNVAAFLEHLAEHMQPVTGYATSGSELKILLHRYQNS